MSPDAMFRADGYWAPRSAGFQYSTEERDEGLILLAETPEGDGQYLPHYFVSPDNLLSDFLQLPRVERHRFYDFARDHGLLGTCPDHCRPYPHRPWADDLGCRTYRGRERASDWERVIHAFRAASRIALKLQHDWLPDAEDWLPIIGKNGIDPSKGFLKQSEDGKPVWLRRSIDQDWEQLGECVSGWWLTSSPTPLLRFRPPAKIELEMCHQSLFGLLTCELVSRIARVESFHICAGCGKPFLPKRQPTKGQRSWCGSPECGRRKLRLHKRRQRERDKAKARET